MNEDGSRPREEEGGRPSWTTQAGDPGKEKHEGSLGRGQAASQEKWLTHTRVQSQWAAVQDDSMPEVSPCGACTALCHDVWGVRLSQACSCQEGNSPLVPLASAFLNMLFPPPGPPSPHKWQIPIHPFSLSLHATTSSRKPSVTLSGGMLGSRSSQSLLPHRNPHPVLGS